MFMVLWTVSVSCVIAAVQSGPFATCGVSLYVQSLSAQRGILVRANGLQGSFKSHLRGAAPAVSAQAAPKILNQRQMKMHQQARELAEALDDCRDDAQVALTLDVALLSARYSAGFL